MITQDPRALVYRKYALKYVQELMGEDLNPAEETVVLLHCGILTGDPVNFSEIAKLLKLYSAERAEELYDQTVRKTRPANKSQVEISRIQAKQIGRTELSHFASEISEGGYPWAEEDAYASSKASK